MANPVGKPPAFEAWSNAEMQALIDKYIEESYAKNQPLTVSGLALALGFTSRQSLLNYEWKEEFVDTIKTAKLRLEEYNENCLYSRDTPTAGVIFNLKNNYWRKDQSQIETKQDPEQFQKSLDLKDKTIQELEEIRNSLLSE